MALGRYIDTGNPVSDHPVNRGLTSWWLPLPGNQGGGSFFDLLRNVTGTLTNNPTWVPGPFGFAALNFDGTNDYVETVDSADTNVGTNAFTLSALVRASSLASSPYVFTKQKTTSAYDGYGLSWGSGEQWLLETYAGSTTTRLFSSAVTNDGDWHHVVATRSGVNLAIYWDGASIGSGSGGSASSLDFAIPLRIGAFTDGSQRWTGQLTDLRLYNGLALSASDAWVLYDQTIREHPDTLRRWSRKAYLFGTAGGSSFSGSGTPSTDATTVSGSGWITNSGTGALTTDTTTTSGTGSVVSFIGSGTPATDTNTTAGSGWITVTGTGALTTDTTTTAGTGSVVSFIGSGTPATDTNTTAGTGWITNSGTGALTTDTNTTAGSGTVSSEGISGSGTPATDTNTIAGAGWITVTGSGTPATDTTTTSGTGSVVSFIGSGTPATDTNTISGTGSVVSFIGSGTPATDTNTIAGSGSVVSFIGTGAPAVSTITVSGSGWVTITGTGAFVTEEITISGDGSIGTVIPPYSPPLIARYGQGSGSTSVQGKGSVNTNITTTGEVG